MEHPLVLYSDAAAQGQEIRLGILLLRAHTHALCYSADVPQEVVDYWDFRKQYIGQGELLCGPLALHCFQQELAGRSVIRFIDNQAALTAMLKGASPVQDNSVMALLLAVQLARFRVSCWWEFVDSHANPSDPLSRDGYKDPTVRVHLGRGSWKKAKVSPIRWGNLVRLRQQLLSRFVAALGGLEPAS